MKLIKNMINPSFNEDRVEEVKPASVEQSEAESAEILEKAIKKAEDDAVDTFSEPKPQENDKRTEDVTESSIDGNESFKISLKKKIVGNEESYWTDLGVFFSLNNDSDLIKQITKYQEIVTELTPLLEETDDEKIKEILGKYSDKHYTVAQLQDFCTKVVTVFNAYESDVIPTIKTLIETETPVEEETVTKCDELLVKLTEITKELPLIEYTKQSVEGNTTFTVEETAVEFTLPEKTFSPTTVAELIEIYQKEIEVYDIFRKEYLKLQGYVIGSKVVDSLLKLEQYVEETHCDLKLMILSVAKFGFVYLKNLYNLVYNNIFTTSVVGVESFRNKMTFFEYVEGQLDQIEEAVEVIEEAVENIEEKQEEVKEENKEEKQNKSEENLSEELAEAVNDEIDEKVEIIETLEEVIEEEQTVSPTMRKIFKKLNFYHAAKMLEVGMPDIVEATPENESLPDEVQPEVVESFKMVLSKSKTFFLSKKIIK